MAFLLLLNTYYKQVLTFLIILILVVMGFRLREAGYKEGYVFGVQDSQKEVEKAYKLVKDLDKKSRELTEKHAKDMARVSKAYQEKLAIMQDNQQVRYVEVQKIVKKPIYRNECFDDSGLHELNRAIQEN